MQDTIATIRRFNRFYTRLAGALNRAFLQTPLTLPEARLLFEIGAREPVTAGTLQAELSMDAGYVSRIVRGFEKNGWIARQRGRDARLRPIALTGPGRTLLDDLDRKQHAAIQAMIDPLTQAERTALANALRTAQNLLDGP